MSDPGIVVSAVIPTRNRPELLCRAVRSVLAQTMPALECIVVIDGPDRETGQALADMDDARIRVIALEDNVGGCEARNIGARAARGVWVALLDDDDEWLPYKLEKQLEAAQNAAEPPTMVVSRFLDWGGKDDNLLRPHIFPGTGQPISEFLWCEVSWLGGIVGFPQTSTWLLRRDFLLEVPFTRGQKVLQDLDWLLRGYADPAMRPVFVEEALTLFHNELTRQRVSKRVDWLYCRNWAIANRDLFTTKALAFFLVIYCINPAAQQGASLAEIRQLLSDVSQHGGWNSKLAVLSFLYICVYPWVGKALPRRKQVSMLYNALRVVRRPQQAEPAR
jgi:glycosyltransferase involved in cell wall biosynthesis